MYKFEWILYVIYNINKHKGVVTVYLCICSCTYIFIVHKLKFIQNHTHKTQVKSHKITNTIINNTHTVLHDTIIVSVLDYLF